MSKIVPLDCIEGLKPSHYYIDTEGNIYYTNKKTGKILPMSPTNNGKGYLGVQLLVNNRKKHFYVHRLVAMQFIPNPLNKKTINHINGNKSDNRMCNLEWATSNEQMQHAARILENSPRQHTIYCKQLNSDEVIRFPSIRACADYLKTDESKIRYALTHTKFTMGWLFSFNKDFPNIKEPPIFMQRKVYLKDKDGNILTYPSLAETAKFLNRSRASIISAMKRNHKCAGYICSYQPFE